MQIIKISYEGDGALYSASGGDNVYKIQRDIIAESDIVSAEADI